MWECQKCREQHEDWFAVYWNCGTSREGVEDPNFVPVADELGGEPGAQSVPPTRENEQLVFVGLNGYALALDRDTGEIVWSNNNLHSGYVLLLIDGDRLIVSCNGYTYCLDALTGRTVWHNPLPGYGVGPTSLASVRGQSPANLLQQARAERAKND